MTDPNIAALYTRLEPLLKRIERLFIGPVKLTLVIRTPELEDGGVLIGNDDHEAAIAEIRRLAGTPPNVDPNEGRCTAIGPAPEHFRCGLYAHDGNEHSALGPSSAPWFGGRGGAW